MKEAQENCTTRPKCWNKWEEAEQEQHSDSGNGEADDSEFDFKMMLWMTLVSAEDSTDAAEDGGGQNIDTTPTYDFDDGY